jgi:hypothetical protein
MAADVSIEGAGEFVTTAEAPFDDPYTGKLMAWDPGARRLSFTANSRNTATRKPLNVNREQVLLQP